MSGAVSVTFLVALISVHGCDTGRLQQRLSLHPR